MSATTKATTAAERCVELAAAGTALREMIDSPAHHFSAEQRAAYKAAVVTMRAAYRLNDAEATEDYRLATEGEMRLDAAEAAFGRFLDDRAEGSFYGRVEAEAEAIAHAAWQGDLAAERANEAWFDERGGSVYDSRPENARMDEADVPPAEEAPAVAPAKDLPAGQTVPNGHYRINNRTFRLRDDFRDDKPVGGQVAYFLGEGNEWVGFAFVSGQEQRIWKKFKGLTYLWAGLRDLLGGDWRQMGEDYAVASGKCFRCGRDLKVPASIHRGLGPDCAGKVG